MPDTIPINQVLQMKTQGLSNSQIIEALEKQGYTPNRIFDAMNQADMKASIEKAPDLNPVQPQNPINPTVTPTQQTDQVSPPYGSSTGTNYYDQDYGPGGMLSGDTEKIEEIAEAIIDEKWEDLTTSMNGVIDWKNKTEQRIRQMEQRVNDLKDAFVQLQKGLTDKMSEYDQHILDVGTEVKAMETVFKKILPTLTSDVTELSKIVKDIKGNKE